MFNRIKETGSKLAVVGGKVKEKAGLFATGIAVEAMMIQQSLAVNTTDNTNNIVKAAVDIVVNIFPLVGAFFIVAGVFKLIMAYRNNQPEDQSTAAKDIVIGAVLVAFRVFAWNTISGLIF